MTESREIIQEVKGGGPPGIRTQTVRILSPLPLPVGLEGHWWVGLDSNQRVSRRRFRSTGECHRPDSATYPFGGGCRNRTCVRFISVCRVSSAVPCHWANPPWNWRRGGDSNSYALAVRWFSGPVGHHLPIPSPWSAGRDSNSLRAGLQSAASSTSASGALSKNLVAEERVELSCPKALVPKTSVYPDFTTRPDCCWSLTTIRAQPG